VTAEDVAVGAASLLDGVLQGAGNVLLSDDLGEPLRTIFARQDGVAHEPEETIIRDASTGLREQKPESQSTRRNAAEVAEKCAGLLLADR